MLPGDKDVLAQQERYKKFLREAEQDRLIQAAGLRQHRRGWPQPHLIHWLGSYVIQWGLQLQRYRPTSPTCCGDCCYVELKKVNISLQA